MAWQPSRIVPGLTQYLAAKGLAFAATDRAAATARQDAEFPKQIDVSRPAAMQRDRPPSPPPPPPAKRFKVDAPVPLQHSELSAVGPKIFLSNSKPAAPALAAAAPPAPAPAPPAPAPAPPPAAAAAPPPPAPGAARSVDELPPLLRDSLLPFQREGIAFAAAKDGRVMIADDMGLGKTVQAIALCWIFRDHWPVLIVMPASMRAAWAEELERWLPQALPPGSIKMCAGLDDSDGLQSASIFLVTYDLLTRGDGLRQRLTLRNPGLMIVDESHYCKNGDAKRTQAVASFAARSQHVILLSGTPALNRPAELFSQINMVQPGLLGTWGAFAKEHCKPVRTRWGMEYKGATNLPALFSKLQSVMIRRKKTDVLKQLPDKRRQFVPMEMSCSALAPVAAMREQLKELKRDTPAFGKLWTECLQHTGISKVPLVLDYLNDLLAGGSKVLLFAHHIKVLDAIEQELFRQKIGHIRIDGSVSPSDRQLRCTEFQSKENVRVALLGLLAAGQGITLTAADTVLFAEMSVTPGVMLQSEDRAHRIGQRSSVNIHYLVAKGTIDEEIWRMIGNKLSVVGRVLDGKTARLGAQPSATLSRTESLPESPPAVSDSDGVTSKAAVFSIFDRRPVEAQQQWSCSACTLLNIGGRTCAACGASCPARPALPKTVSVDGERREQSHSMAFSGSFAVSKNTQRVYVFSDPHGANLIGTITQSQLDNDEMSNAFSASTFRVVSCFVSEFFSLRAIQQRQLSDCIITLPLSARVNELAAAERCRSSSTIRHSSALPCGRNGDAACGMCGKAFAASGPVAGRFCSSACKDEYQVLASSAAVRRQLYELEHGVCQICKVDAALQYRTVKALAAGGERLRYLMSTEHRLRGRLDKMLVDPKEGDFWQADHILPVKEGGGQANISNFRTLCTPCHEAATRALMSRLAAAATSQAAEGSKDIRAFFSK